MIVSLLMQCLSVRQYDSYKQFLSTVIVTINSESFPSDMLRPCNDTNVIPTRSVRTPPRSLDDMDGKGWEVREWVAMVSRVSVEGLGGLGMGCEWLAGFSL